MSKVLCCDFCREIVAELWTYNHPAFRTLACGEVIEVSQGTLSLCDDCQRLFEAGEIAMLVKRIREQRQTDDVRLIAQLRHYVAAMRKKVDQPARHMQLEETLP